MPVYDIKINEFTGQEEDGTSYRFVTKEYEIFSLTFEWVEGCKFSHQRIITDIVGINRYCLHDHIHVLKLTET